MLTDKFIYLFIRLVVIGLAPSHPALLPAEKRPKGVRPLPPNSRLAQNAISLCPPKSEIEKNKEKYVNGGIIGVNFDVGSIKRDETKVHGKRKKV